MSGGRHAQETRQHRRPSGLRLIAAGAVLSLCVAVAVAVILVGLGWVS